LAHVDRRKPFAEVAIVNTASEQYKSWSFRTLLGRAISTQVRAAARNQWPEPWV